MASELCYGRTNAGTPCELPPGHYPATHHLVTFDSPGCACGGRIPGHGSWMSWTDESMAEFARIANEAENAHICNAEHGHA